MERRIVAQMLTCMDDLSEQPLAGGTDGGTERGDPARLPKHVVVIGAAVISALNLGPGSMLDCNTDNSACCVGLLYCCVQ